MAEDPRDVANLVLEVANNMRLKTSNLALNKIVYFLHGNYLAKYDEPLVDAVIEAWEYGPVFREIYHEFKQYGRATIERQALRTDPTDGRRKVMTGNLKEDRLQFVRELAAAYLKIRPGRLVDMSHVHDGPWFEAWNYEGTVNPGMAISDQAIRAHFAQQVRH